MAGRKSDEELLVITKMYDFILWSCNHTSKFPRNHRFVLGERIERNLYDLLESLIEAKYSRARTPLLQKANLRLEILRFQMRLAKDLQCLRVESYACRRGKGTHAAVHRCQEFSRQYRYVLKADIRKFFPTMDHQILKDRIARKIKDPDVMWLVGEIIDGSNPQDQFCEACQGAKSIAVPCRAEVRLTGESPFGQIKKNRSGGSGRPKGSNAPPDFLFEGSYRWKTCGSPGQNGTFSHGRFICRQRFELKQNFVVIVHLSPTYESTLAEILQYSTTTPVMAVRGSHRANTHPTTARLRWSCLLLVPAACSWVCPSRRRCVSCRCRSFSPSQSQ